MIEEVDDEELTPAEEMEVYTSTCLQCGEEYDPDKLIMVVKKFPLIWWHSRSWHQDPAPCKRPPYRR